MSSDMKHEDEAFILNHSDIVLNDIIDITTIDLNDQERWLLQRDSTHSIADVNDIRTWLQPTFLDNYAISHGIDNSNKKLIDTRTWTRPKKRFSRLSFDSIKEIPSLPQSTKSDIWQVENSEILHNHCFDKQLELKLGENSEETIPSMLRVASSSNIQQATMGQESLEAFLNMSQSNGIDSFINMEAPEFNETFFINTTRSSIISTSPSISTYTRDDDNYFINQNIGMGDSQILTESMMHTSIFNDESHVNFNDEFANDNINVSVIENTNYSPSKFDNTIINVNDTFHCMTTQSKEENLKGKIHSTFTSAKISQDSNAKSYGVDEIFEANSLRTNHLSNPLIKESESVDEYDDCLDILDKEHTEVRLNATFDAESLSSSESLNSTLTSTRCSENSIETPIDRVELSESLNTTYIAVESELPILLKSKIDINQTFQASPHFSKTINSTFSTGTHMNETFNKHVTSMSPQTDFNQTYRRNPTAVKAKKSCELNTTYDQHFVAPQPPAIVNRYQTYRKNQTRINRIKSTCVDLPNEDSGVHNCQIKSIENSVQTKTSTQQLRKLHTPKKLSRLSQGLQKSNPNLASTHALKAAAIPPRMSNFGFNRQRQIKNNDPSLSNKLYSITKLPKCGSEQILDGPKGHLEYSQTDGSTESLESIQSTHSAPDLDDRLSTRLDSNHDLYTHCATVNMDEIHKIVQKQEASLKCETMADRRILENNWVTDKTNLLSPILKESETLGSRGSSPNSIDSTVKTSSPILSPAESFQALNTNATTHFVDDKITVKLVESGKQTDEKQKTFMMSTKPKIPEYKFGLRQPINRGTNATSGIPRPASRIPAPRFTRANIKKQEDIRKSIL